MFEPTPANAAPAPVAAPEPTNLPLDGAAAGGAPAPTPPAADPVATPAPAGNPATIEANNPGQKISSPEDTPVSTDAPQKSEAEEIQESLFELLGLTPPTADPAKAEDKKGSDPANPDADPFHNPNSEPEIFRKEVESWKSKFNEAAPVVEAHSKLTAAIDADPMLKAIVEQKLAGKDVVMSKLVQELLTKRLVAPPKTEMKAPAGNSPKPQTLQQMINEGGNQMAGLQIQRG